MEDETVDLWATDEVHFQQHGSRCQMWIPPETKDPVLHLDGKPFRVEEIEEAALHPADDQFRMRYVIAASRKLAEEAVAWLHSPIHQATDSTKPIAATL